MKLPGIKKSILYFLITIIGLIILAAVTINLPFAHRFITSKANNILSNAHIPITINSIGTILPNSIVVNGIILCGIKGDTIIYAEKAGVSVATLALIRKRVLITSVILSNPGINLSRADSSHKINIAEAFSNRKSKVPGKKTGKKKQWEVSVESAEISGISFRMQDSVSGIFIDQKVDNIKVRTNKMSIIDKALLIQSLDIRGAKGDIRISAGPVNEKGSNSSPWRFSVANISLANITESFDDSGKRIMAGISIEECKIKSRESDIKNKIIDISRFSMSGTSAGLRINRAPGEGKNKNHTDEFVFPWSIKCSDLDLENISLSLGEYPDKSPCKTTEDLLVSNLNINLSELVLSRNSTGFESNNISFDLNNGFSLKKFKGDLDSKNGATSANLSIETGNSGINLSVSSGQNIFDLILKPEEIISARISIDKTKISLKDLLFFKTGLNKLPFINSLAKIPFTIKGDIIVQDFVFKIPDFYLSQASNIGLSLQGQIAGGLNPEKASGNLNFGIPDINTEWLTGILKEAGFNYEIKDLTKLSIEGTISDSLKSPRFTLVLKSDIGNIDLSGSLDLNKDSFKLTSDLTGIQIGRILNNSLIGSMSGSGEITGKGMKSKSISADGVILVDSLRFKGYDYTGAKIDFNILPPDIKFSLLIDDPLMNMDLTADIYKSDSLLALKSNATFKGNLRELNLFKDTLTVAGVLRGELKKGNKSFKSDLSVSDIVLTTSKKDILIKNYTGSFISDTVKTYLTGESDFFNFAVHLEKPVSELKSVREEYRHYVNSFTDPMHNEAAARVSFLPKIDSKINFSYHEALEIFVKQLHYENIDISLNNNPREGRLEYIILGRDIKYNNLAFGKINTHITDSAGYLNISFSGDDCIFSSYPVNKLLLTGNMGGWKGITSLSLLGKQNNILYGFEINAKIDSSVLYLKVPSKQLILNGISWQLDSEDLLTYDFAEKNLAPDLKMHFNDSYFNIFTDLTDGYKELKFDLKNVNTTSLIPENLINGNPGGIISGSAVIALQGDKRIKLNTNLNFKDARWSDLKFSNIKLDGNFITDSKESWALDLVSRLDSSEIILNAEKPENGRQSINAVVKNFKVNTIEPFVKKYVSDIKGVISGNIDVSSNEGNQSFDGEIDILDGGLRIIPLNSGYRIPDEKIRFAGKKIILNNFTILDSLDHKLIIDGSLDLSKPGSTYANLELLSSDLQIMNSGEKKNTSFYGKVFIDSRLSVNGLISNPDLKGTITLKGGTEIFYSKKEDLSLSESEKVITFISGTPLNRQNINSLGSGSVARRKGISVETMVEIDPETRINFNLSQKLYIIDLKIQGGGELNYNMLENNQMNLSGEYAIGEGTANVKMIGWPNKLFRITSGGTVRWDGNVEDPVLQFEAINRVRTSYTNPVDGKVRDVDFNVMFKLSDRLSELNLVFTVNTPDQYLMSIINTLSPEELMRQAFTVLLFEKIDLPGVSTSSDYVTQQVNQMVTSQLNALTKTTIKGVDISFGLDTYTSASQSGGEQTKTSLSYDVKKSLLNNRAKIEISGRVNDYSNQQSSSNLSLNNFSFEYRLDSASTKFIKVYNEHTYEDVFEGEVIKTGIGFIYRRSYRSLSDIWKRDDKKKKLKQKVQ